MKQPITAAPDARRTLLSRVNRRELIVGLLLFGSMLLLYAQVWNFGYCILDDSATSPTTVTSSKDSRGPESTGSFTTVHDANWIPLTWISLMLDSDLYGGRAGGYHLTNALLHAANAVLLLLALSRATGSLFRSGFVAAFFALHPLHVESVAWIAEAERRVEHFLWTALAVVLRPLRDRSEPLEPGGLVALPGREPGLETDAGDAAVRLFAVGLLAAAPGRLPRRFLHRANGRQRLEEKTGRRSPNVSRRFPGGIALPGDWSAKKFRSSPSPRFFAESL